ncbi:tRNA pseudouridine synthase [Candidatus Magnetoovum chiemensis]|nr:tRNA pseudouridine synthase [Candidatus Magnetoovum chiemensis]
MDKILLMVQYDGTNYSGWQRQNDRTTVQGKIEEAVERITRQKTSVKAAGRTDRGVHALGQIAVFDCSATLQTDKLKHALNAVLPKDIRVKFAKIVPNEFHPIYDARKKTYCYIIRNDKDEEPFFHKFYWHIPFKLDISAMKEGGKSFIGIHDFKSFCAADTDVKTTIRELFSLTIETFPFIELLGFRIDGSFIKITVQGAGFLRHMVRNIVGTLVELGKGRCNYANIKEIIEKRDRTYGGPTAPARGLFLESIDY